MDWTTWALFLPAIIIVSTVTLKPAQKPFTIPNRLTAVLPSKSAARRKCSAKLPILLLSGFMCLDTSIPPPSSKLRSTTLVSSASVSFFLPWYMVIQFNNLVGYTQALRPGVKASFALALDTQKLNDSTLAGPAHKVSLLYTACNTELTVFCLGWLSFCLWLMNTLGVEVESCHSLKILSSLSSSHT